ncbi:MAG TPA: hypothetical protein VK966_01165 [Longimicrobiales bacterium]|nr:hypothetical protein [Longimicrobiales bacterium]
MQGRRRTRRRRPAGGIVPLAAMLAVLGGCDGDGTGPLPSTGFTAVAAGAAHSCALGTDGRAYCWGRGHNGELGVGTLTPGVSAPAPTAAAPAFEDITAGYYHTCALTAEGTAYCWGWNSWGQAGIADPDETFIRAPTPVAGEHTFTRLVAGWYHTCGLTEEGAVYCWGNNGDGQLGDGTQSHRRTPQPIVAQGPFSELAVGGFHTCAAGAGGQAYCWGRNIEGQLGDGGRIASTAPVPVSSELAFQALDAGRAHTCGVSGTAIYCWGSNDYGQLGTGRPGERGLPGSTRPSQVARDQAFVSVTAGSDHTCAVDEPGTGYCWGAGAFGQLGLGTTADQASPRMVQRPEFRQIAAGFRTHTCGVSSGQRLYCWGTGDVGQLGNPATTATSVPLQVVNPEPFER